MNKLSRRRFKDSLNDAIDVFLDNVDWKKGVGADNKCHTRRNKPDDEYFPPETSVLRELVYLKLGKKGKTENGDV